MAITVNTTKTRLFGEQDCNSRTFVCMKVHTQVSERMQILMCITLFTELSYVGKIANSCIHIRTVWAVKWQKIFVNIANYRCYLTVWF